MNQASVVVTSLHKVYVPSPPWMRFLVRTNLTHDVVALDGVDFEVGPGEILAVVGPNGAGKSTAFRILVGLTSPTGGSAKVMGFDCANESKSVRRLVGWMPAEDRSLLLRLSCRENLLFHGRLHNLPKAEIEGKVSSVLADVGLADSADDTPFALSAGMRTRLQLARALLHEPSVLILDEPTGSVDPVAAHGLLELITDIVDSRKIAALISSHRLEEIEALHSHVILLDKGSVRYDGDLDELRRQYDRARLEFEFSDDTAAASAESILLRSRSLENVSRDGKEVLVTLQQDARISAVLADLGAGVDSLVHIRESRTPLRDILASMYAGST
jgi:ABC-2 type transport system ATP-binding protein